MSGQDQIIHDLDTSKHGSSNRPTPLGTPPDLPAPSTGDKVQALQERALLVLPLQAGGNLLYDSDPEPDGADGPGRVVADFEADPSGLADVDHPRAQFLGLGANHLCAAVRALEDCAKHLDARFWKEEEVALQVLANIDKALVEMGEK